MDPDQRHSAMYQHYYKVLEEVAIKVDLNSFHACMVKSRSRL